MQTGKRTILINRYRAIFHQFTQMQWPHPRSVEPASRPRTSRRARGARSPPSGLQFWWGPAAAAGPCSCLGRRQRQRFAPSPTTASSASRPCSPVCRPAVALPSGLASSYSTPSTETISAISRIWFLSDSCGTERTHFTLGLFSDRARYEQHDVRSVEAIRLRVSIVLQNSPNHFGVVDVHLTAIDFEEDFPAAPVDVQVIQIRNSFVCICSADRKILPRNKEVLQSGPIWQLLPSLLARFVRRTILTMQTRNAAPDSESFPRTRTYPGPRKVSKNRPKSHFTRFHHFLLTKLHLFGYVRDDISSLSFEQIWRARVLGIFDVERWKS